MQDVGDFCIVSDCVLEKYVREQKIKKHGEYIHLKLSDFWQACRHILMCISNFIACLLTIVVYLLLFDKIYATSRFTMGATVFITAITMAEFGHELAGYIGATLYCLTIRR